MKIKAIRVILLLIVTALLISLAACYTGPGPEIPVSFDPGTEIKPQGKIKATTYLRSGAESEKAFDNWIKAYNRRYPNVTIKPEIISWADLALKIASGDIGDVYYGCEQDVYSYAVIHKAAMALDAYIELLDIDITDMFTGLYELGVANGYLYMVPSDINPGVLYVNLSALTEAGLSMPDNSWTYDEFKNILRQSTVVEADGSYSRVGISYGDDFPGIMRFMIGYGGQWVDSVNKKIHLVSDENCLKGVNELISLIADGYMYVPGLTGEVGAKFANISGLQDFAFTQGTYISRVGFAEDFATLGLDWNVINWPEFPNRVVVGGATGFFVYSKTKNPDAAATFCLFMIEDEGQYAFNTTYGGGIPTTKSNYEADFWRFPYPEEEFNYDAFVAYPEAFVGNWPEVYTPTEIAKLLNDFSKTFYTRHFNNVKSYMDSLQELEEQVNELWAQLFEG